MALRGTDPESYITEYTSVYEDEIVKWFPLRSENYLTQGFDRMVFLESIHPQTRHLILTIHCYEIKSTGLWVN